MAIIISQQPTDYNLVVQPQVWTLSGLISQDGYALVVKDAAGVTIATVKQPANPAGVAHFDVGKILQSQMGISFYETTPEVSTTLGETYSYRITPASYTDNIITEEPSPSGLKVVINGYADWRVLNWDYTPYMPVPVEEICEQGLSPNWRYSTQKSFLTNWPADTYTLRSNQYHTLGFFNRPYNWQSGGDLNTNEQAAYVRILMYDIDNNLILTTIYSINDTTGLGPRLDYDSTFAGDWTDPEIVGIVGAGVQNLKDAGYWPQNVSAVWNQVMYVWGSYSQIWNLASSSAIVDHYTVQIMSNDQCYWNANGAPVDGTAATLQNYVGDVIYSYDFDIADPCSQFEPVTVSFVNQYGVKDYYTFDRRNNYNVNSNRQEYYKTNASWSSSTFEIGQHAGGATQFSAQIETVMTLSTDWMDDNVSSWLEELYTSPAVQIYTNGQWEPCVITSNNYEQKTYSRNRMFQHTLTVKYANNKKVQLG